MARLIKAACPQCGAGVQLNPTNDWVTCSYCGTSSFIRKDPQHGPPPPTAGYPQYRVIDIPAAKHPGMKMMLVWVGVVFALGAIPAVAGIINATSVTHNITASLASVGAGTEFKVGDRPMLGDATGDEALDPIVPTWTYEGGKTLQRIAALEANSGSVVWTSDPLGETAVIAVVGRAALVASATTVIGLDLRSGKKIWERPLPEKVEMFCDDGKGGAAFAAKDEQVYGIDLTTGELAAKGKLRPNSRPPHTPAEIQASHPIVRKNLQQRLDRWEKEQAATVSCPPASSPAYWSRGAGVTKSSVELKLEGVGVEEVWRDRETGPLFFLAERRVGSRLPMIGAASPDGANVLWKAELPSKNPMGAEEGEPEAFTMGRGRAIAGYLQKSEKLFVVSAWTLEGGQRQWEVSMPADDLRWPGIQLSDRHVFVKNSTELRAFALADGRELWKVGK
jgi:ribosomal protein S27AE